MTKMNKAEKQVYDDLCSRGFVVSRQHAGSANGVDLVAMKEGSAVSIEVKSVVIGARAKTVRPVLSSGRKCNWIAIVLGSDIIYQPMSEHLKLCSQSGSRGVTELIKLRQMIIAEIG